MIRIRKGTVNSIISRESDIAVVEICYDGITQKGINYKSLTGDIEKGDIVYINTSATYLGLGSGGYDFIMINETRGSSLDFEDAGHIMKMRYTPYQVKCNCAGEKENILHSKLKEFKHLNGMAVLTAELHSMLMPAACTLKYINKDIKIAYIMTDGGCLPIDFSSSVRELKAKGVITYAITAGNSFGGDMEAVNIYDALAIAYSLECDTSIITLGPGIAGTGTKYGFSGIEQGYIIDAVNTLNGNPVVIPRISFMDSRERHFGISHHSLTVLSEIAKTSANVIFPVLEKEKTDYIKSQIYQYSIDKKHNTVFLSDSTIFDAVKYYNVKCSTMGRDLYMDKEFFLACGCGACYAAHVMEHKL
jgi:hypothetical protein